MLSAFYYTLYRTAGGAYGPAVSSAEKIWDVPFSYYGPYPFQDGSEGYDSGFRLEGRKTLPAAAGRYCVGGLLVSDHARERISKTAGQGLFGDYIKVKTE